jgi:hypothetical protein
LLFFAKTKIKSQKLHKQLLAASGALQRSNSAQATTVTLEVKLTTKGFFNSWCNISGWSGPVQTKGPIGTKAEYQPEGADQLFRHKFYFALSSPFVWIFKV